MAQELLYTSAPRGLKPGSRGFCTVEATAGMSPTLVAALEGLSGYRHIAPPGDASNPIVFSHVTLSIGGRPKSIVSRIADAGADYSGRTNKIASHLVLDPPERPAGGPAWLGGRSDLLKTAYAGEPKTLPPRSVPAEDRPAAPCTAWKAAAGDGGWAGVLAEACLADPNRPAYLVVPPGLDVRRLFEEAIALLPPDRRWAVTFTTLYTSLPQTVTCQWRAVLAGSKEAHESRRFVQALRLDLTSSLGAATGGALVEAARTGRLAKAPPPMPKREKAAAPILATAAPVVDEETPLDVMPRVDSPRPERLIEPLVGPPEMRRRSRVKTVLWIGAGAVCLTVAVAPLVVGINRLTTGAVKPVTSEEVGEETDKGSNGEVSSVDSPTSDDAAILNENDRELAVGDTVADGSTSSPDTTSDPMAADFPATSTIVNSDSVLSTDADDATPNVSPAKPAVTGPAFIPIVLQPAGVGLDTYFTDDITVPTGVQHELRLFFTRNAIDGLKVSPGKSPHIVVAEKNSVGIYADVIWIGLEAAQDNRSRVIVRGATKHLLKYLPLAALQVSTGNGLAVEQKTYLLSVKKVGAPTLPRHFQHKSLDLRVVGDSQLLLESLTVSLVVIDWAGQEYSFIRHGRNNTTNYSLSSDAIAELFRKNIHVDALLEFILDAPPRITVSFDEQALSWKLVLDSGELWSAFPSKISELLLRKKLVFSSAVGLSSSDINPIEKHFQYSAVIVGGGDSRVDDMRNRFKDALASAKDELEDAQKNLAEAKNDSDKKSAQDDFDKEKRELKELEDLKMEYEQFVEAATFVAKANRTAFFDSTIKDIDVHYEVVNGEDKLEIPFAVDLRN